MVKVIFVSGQALPEIETRELDPEYNPEGMEIEFEDEHFHAREDIEEDYQLLLEQKRMKHKHWLSNYALKRINMNQNYILLIVGQVGCQPKGSKVLMKDGSWKTVETIVVGDEVISPQYDGSDIISKVVQTHRDYSDKCFDVVNEVSQHILYSCSNHHKIPHFDIKSGMLQNTKAEQLSGQK